MLRNVPDLDAVPVVATLDQLVPIRVLDEERAHGTAHEDAHGAQHEPLAPGRPLAQQQVKGRDAGAELARGIRKDGPPRGREVVEAVERDEPPVGEALVGEGAHGVGDGGGPGGGARGVGAEQLEGVGADVEVCRGRGGGGGVRGGGDRAADLPRGRLHLGLVEGQADVAKVGPRA